MSSMVYGSSMSSSALGHVAQTANTLLETNVHLRWFFFKNIDTLLITSTFIFQQQYSLIIVISLSAVEGYYNLFIHGTIGFFT